MRRRHWPAWVTPALLAGTCAGLILQLAQTGPPPPTPPPGAAATALAPAPAGPDRRDVAQAVDVAGTTADRGLIINFNLFSERRLPPDLSGPAPASVAPVTNLELVGLIAGANGQVAVLQAPGGDRPVLLRPGERFGAIGLVEIGDTHVVLATPTGQQRLDLAFETRANGAQPAPATGEPVTPAPQPRRLPGNTEPDTDIDPD